MKNNHDSKSTAQGCGFLILLLIFGVIFVRACSDTDEKIKNDQSQINYLDVFFESERFVERLLTSPSTVKYCFRSEDKLLQINDSTFIVRNCFDSQNGFGAMVRSNYSCKITFFESSGQVKCEDLVIN